MHSFDNSWEQLQFSTYLSAWLIKLKSTGRIVLCLNNDLLWQWIQVLAVLGLAV